MSLENIKTVERFSKNQKSLWIHAVELGMGIEPI
jgi:hypothetical protein